ncbi:carnitine dehydratase [Bacterioplanes sanyensis]|uniref:Carnitine dehydratase n=1 Tax=Bacterioplanes sanyensis TaxID=1249553 RepID=A0A222FIU7_9GAMM|nr:CaiB/BaiF CoA-transferase family protein [Bacterioplanes sanyensis]ASP38967.1 carnitine dehydratase [Bacterioplanes sanyensis]
MLPLAGITVLDLSRLLPGPLCSMHLRDMGAQVIKVEDTGAGDYLRHLGMPAGQVSPVFDLLNANKRSIGLDLRKPQGQQIFKRLLASADVVLESFRPGVMARLGLGFDTLAQQRPGLVMCALSGYGQSGPWAQLAGHDMNYCATAGVLEQSGRAGQMPSLSNFQLADIAGGALSAAMAILAALVGRLQAQLQQRPLESCYLDISMTDCAFANHVIPLSGLNLRQSAPRGEDMLTGQLPYYDIYATQDGRHMALAALEEKFWQRFCAAIDKPHWQARYHHQGGEQQALRDDITALFASRTQQQWRELLQHSDCCVTPILTVSEAFQHPQLLAREMIHTLTNAAGQQWQVPAPAIRFSGQRFTPHGGGPEQGEHSKQILQQIGCSNTDIDRWQQDQVIRLAQ